MKKLIKIILGILILNGVVFVWINDFLKFGQSAEFFLKGGLMWLGVIFSLILIFFGIDELKE